jgi:hypothetical protein
LPPPPPSTHNFAGGFSPCKWGNMMNTDSLPLPSDSDYGQLLGLLLEHALRHGLYALVDGLAGQLEEGSSCLGPEQKQLLYLRCGLTFLLSSGPLPEILNTSFTSTFQVRVQTYK